jgi:hypothetical protein
MGWRKLGVLYDPSVTIRHPKLLTHAANPLPVHMEGDVYRVFYSGRDLENRSSVGAVDIDVVRRKIVREHFEPFFEYGGPESFFADGVSIGNCYTVDHVCYMLFMGWQTPKVGHWRGDIGRLIVRRDLSLELGDNAAFLGCSEVDKVSLSYPWVLPDRFGGFDMWYGSTISWDIGNGEMLHVINHAKSIDGHNWDLDGLAVPYVIGEAQAFSRPTVLRNVDGSLEMWFSYRGVPPKKYRIGYAVSSNGHDWNLALDQVGIDLSSAGWDSEMIEYPFVFEHNGQRLMLYNGNGHGRTGFGLAVWK